MDETLITAATAKAYAHINKARSSLIGRRLPLAGVHRDMDAALADLRAAHTSIGEAIRLIESSRGKIGQQNST